MKNQKGITLVALVITIVVLLILAGVTISMVLGPNGVLTNSRKAKENSARGTANDALSTALSSLSTDYYANGTSGTMLAQVTKDNLEAILTGYEITVGNVSGEGDNATIKVRMKDKSKGDIFTGTVTATLTIKEFEDGDKLSGNQGN